MKNLFDALRTGKLSYTQFCQMSIIIGKLQERKFAIADYLDGMEKEKPRKEKVKK